MNWKICFELLFITLLSCHSKRDGKGQIDEMKNVSSFMLEDQNHFYNELKEMVDKELLLHFPQVLDTCNLQIVGPPIDKKDLYSLQVTNKFYDSSFIDGFSKVSIAQYSGDDSCLLTIDSIESFKNNTESHFDQCLDTKFPIPNFKRNKFRDLSTASKLPSDFRIIVIEAKPDTILPDSLRKVKHWKRGFSRGVAFSNKEKVIIYWVIRWG